MSTDAVLLTILVLATSIWVGGYVAIAVVARAASATLDPGTRVAFFRSLGRTYLRIGLSALLVALITGALMLRDRDWDAVLTAATLVVVALVVLLGIAVVQAKRMTRLRRQALDEPADQHVADGVARGARGAGILRAVLGVLSLVLVVLGAVLATT